MKKNTYYGTGRRKGAVAKVTLATEPFLLPVP